MLYQIKLSLRRLRNNMRSSVITIGGLALGIAAYILVLEYVSFEKSVNAFHKNLPDVYRLINEGTDGKTWPETEPGWVYHAAREIPEIKSYCRFDESIANGVVRANLPNSEPFREANIGYGEGNFFSFFSFPIINGKTNALEQPNTVFISDNTSAKYFKDQNPIGQTLIVNNQFGQTNYTVVGVYRVPANSSIRSDMILSLETLKNPANLNDNDWAQLDNTGSQFINTCFLLNSGANLSKVEARLNELRNKFKADKDGVRFRLQPLSNMHLAASLNDNSPTTGNLRYVYILTIIAILILLIAWFNYINLSTANAIKRANEVGVRKVIGASRTNLIGQFVTEAMIVYGISTILALFLMGLIQPIFNKLIGQQLSLTSVTFTWTWLIGFSLIIAGSLLTAVYTAYIISGFNPVQTLKGKLAKSTKGTILRKALVVGQFTISISLILATVLIYQQLRFMQKSKLGIQTEQMIVINGAEIGKDSTFKNRSASFMNELSMLPFVKDYSLTGTVPGNYYNFSTNGFTQPKSLKGEELETYSFAIIDDRYLNAYGIKLVAGRNFTNQETSVKWNNNDKVLMNERAIQQLGFNSPEEALNTRVQWDERTLQVLGVVKNYHHMGLQKQIEPMIFYPQQNGRYLSLRLSTTDIQQSMEKLEGAYKKFFPGNPFEYFFEDENFNKQYQAEQKQGMIFSAASIWAILIAFLGLFGLTTFSIESRTKEIGIRKVLGASAAGMVGLLSKDFIKLIMIAAVIASPLAWWAISRWLQDFAYRVEIHWWLFVLVAVITALAALLTIGIQTVKAALSNPVKSIRTD